jgi:hypothetical protein
VRIPVRALFFCLLRTAHRGWTLGSWWMSGTSALKGRLVPANLNTPRMDPTPPGLGVGVLVDVGHECGGSVPTSLDSSRTAMACPRHISNTSPPRHGITRYFCLPPDNIYHPYVVPGPPFVLESVYADSLPHRRHSSYCISFCAVSVLVLSVPSRMPGCTQTPPAEQ